jgi:hypothetical protein
LLKATGDGGGQESSSSGSTTGDGSDAAAAMSLLWNDGSGGGDSSISSDAAGSDWNSGGGEAETSSSSGTTASSLVTSPELPADANMLPGAWRNATVSRIEQSQRPTTRSAAAATTTTTPAIRKHQQELSRREAFRRTSVLLLSGTAIGGATLRHQWEELQKSSKKIADLNYTRIIQESSITITVDGPMACECLDSKTFQKVQKLKLPGWVPPYLVPPPKVIRDTTNVELLTAAVLAGSVVEMSRTTLLYPLLTLKTRVQTDVNTRIRKRRRAGLKPKRRLQVAQLQARKHFREGQLYAGLWPSLFISVPATGVYFGVRDIVQRSLVPYTDAVGGSLTVALCAALVADVSSLLIRTPADTLAVRLQAATGEEAQWEEHEGRSMTVEERRAYLQGKIGDWFLESFERMPALILTDLPYLLSRIAINRLLLDQGGPVSLGRYEGIVLASAVLCGLLTTPFDVARTRILVDSDSDPSNGIDGGSGEGLWRTFHTISQEGGGGVRNLFAGWLERVAYLGIGRAWIEPLQILGYIALRDFILLEWF